MRHVLDLDGDWFAMAPLPTPAYYPPHDAAYVAAQPPLAVGDVLANVRTKQCHYDDAGYACCDDAPAWADPPFLRVVEVLPIVRDHQRKPYVLPTVGGRMAWVVRKSRPDRLINLDYQPLGGWAVRVEGKALHQLPNGYLGRYALVQRPPVVDGPPLNKEAQP